MTSASCPRDDPLRSMSPDNVFEVECGNCGEMVEFIANEEKRKCDACGQAVPNPTLAQGDAG